MDLHSVSAVIAADRSALDGWSDGDAWLAGGTWLFSEPQPAIHRLVDLTAFGWPAITAGEAGLEIAATCTLAELSGWAGPADWPATALIPECCRALLGSFKIWHTATVGGNLCLSLPAGPMTSLTAALDGVCAVWLPGGAVRRVAVADFVLGPGENVLTPGALLRSVFLPASALRGQTAFRQMSLSPLGRSAVVVIGRRSPGDGSVAITITAAVPRPVRFDFAAGPTAEDVRGALDAAGLGYYDDPHGDPAWRGHLTRLYAEEVRRELAGDDP